MNEDQAAGEREAFEAWCTDYLLPATPSDRQIIDAFAPYREFPANWIADFGRAVLALEVLQAK